MTDDNETLPVHKRRRSSLFVGRRSVSWNTSEATSGNAEKKEVCTLDLEEYIEQLKKCRKKWILCEKEMKMKLTAAKSVTTSLDYDRVQENYLDFLDEEDKQFMMELPSLQDVNCSNEITEMRRKIEVLNFKYESDKTKSEISRENIHKAYRIVIMNKIKELSKDIDDLSGFTSYVINDQASPILQYDSD